MDKATDRTYYEVLLITPGAPNKVTNEEVKAAYRELAKQYHPDKGPSADEDEFKVVNAAYQKLKTKARRDAYDRKLNNLRADDDAAWGDSGTASTAPTFDLVVEQRKIQQAFATEVSRIKRKYAGLRQREESTLRRLLDEAGQLVAPAPVVMASPERAKALTEAGIQYQLDLQKVLDGKLASRVAIKSYADAKAVIAAEEDAEHQYATGEATKLLREQMAEQVRTESRARLDLLERDERLELGRAEKARDADLAALAARK